MENNRLSKNEISFLRKLQLKKFRDIESKFIIEGKHLIEEALKSKSYSSNIEFVALSNDYHDSELLNILAKKKIPLKFSSAKNITSLSDTKTPQGIIALMRKRNFFLQGKFNIKITVLLERINDPGNLGTILRTCWWFNVKNIFLSSGCADIFNPKVIRASQGAIFNLNIFENCCVEKELDILFKSGFEIFLTTSHGADEITTCDLSKNSKNVFVFGNETSGISPKLLENKNYRKITINSFSDCESLNVSSAVAVVLGYVRLK
ncbi:MAG: RNA methyltransferase [Ignavibacteria bacterium]|nr:RNA methyltransferase [Ignavibacteria bacterium]